MNIKKLIFLKATKNLVYNLNFKTVINLILIKYVFTHWISIKLAMEAPVVHPTGDRKSKIIAIQRMALTASLATSQEGFKTVSQD